MNPNEASLRGAYEAMAAGDGRSLSELLTPDTTWVICGKGKLAGSYQGLDEIFGLWKAIAEQTGGGMRLAVEDILANEERGVALVVAQGERNGRQLHERHVAVFEFTPDGKIGRASFVYENPDEYDSFWSD